MKKELTITTTEPEIVRGYFGSFWTIEARINDRPVLDTYCDSKEEAESLAKYLQAAPEVAKLMEIFKREKYPQKLSDITRQLIKLNEIL